MWVKTNLQGAILRRVNLWDADLKEAELQNTDLFLVRSEWARCNQAYMQRTELMEAELDRAELGRALRVTSDQAKEANTDETTVLLADFA